MVRNKARRAISNWSRASLSFPCTMKICLAYPLVRMVGHSEVAHQKLAGRINLSLDILKLALMGPPDRWDMNSLGALLASLADIL
jgi:hypothetical protein